MWKYIQEIALNTNTVYDTIAMTRLPDRQIRIKFPLHKICDHLVDCSQFKCHPSESPGHHILMIQMGDQVTRVSDFDYTPIQWYPASLLRIHKYSASGTLPTPPRSSLLLSKHACTVISSYVLANVWRLQAINSREKSLCR